MMADDAMTVWMRFVSYRNDAGAHLATRLVRCLGGSGFVASGDGAAPPPEVAVIFRPPACDT